jgi:Zn-finger nucleic acid-binding protein
MKCPRCATELEKRAVGNVEIDECPGCKGSWFDEDELRKAKDEADPDLEWVDFELWKHPDRFRVAAKPIECPKCAVRLAGIEYDKTGVIVDHCVKCHGAWLDAGEFEKIVAALEQELMTKSVPGYVRASLEEAREILTGPETLASEWKDFLSVLRMLQYRVLSGNPTVGKALADLQTMGPF